MKTSTSRLGGNIYISQAETAAMLGVTDRTVRTMISDGRLRAYRLGRTVRLKLTEVEAAMQPIPAATA